MNFVVSQFFSIGNFQVRYYSIFFVGAILLGYFIARKRAVQLKINLEQFDELVFWAVVIGFLSARIYYVLFYFDFYRGNLAEVFKIWHGGLAIYGGIIGGTLTILFFARRYKISFLKLADIFAFALPLGQALGRIGNYFNYEAFGTPTNLPWKMFVPEQFRPLQYKSFQYFHPAFLYEMVWDILVFAFLYNYAKKQPRTGMVFAAYLILYSMGRFAIEAIRTDSAYFGHFKGDQITAIFMAALAILIILRKNASQTN